MKKITYISLLAATFALGACSDNEMLDSSQLPEGNLTIRASINGGQVTSRTYIFNTSAMLRWLPTEDEIGVYSTSSSNVKFFCVSKDNKEVASFSGSLASSDSPQRAYYPYSEIGGLSGEGNKTFTVTFPEKIVFEECAKAGKGRMATNAPMIAPAYDASNQKFAFKHVCGLMRITIASIPTDAASLVITSEGANISGTGTIADITAEAPQLSSPTEGGKTVTITLPETTTYGEKTFYIPLPVATYSKLTMELKKADDSVILSKSISSLSVACGQLVDMNKLTGLELKPSEVKETLATALQNGGTVDVTIKEVAAEDATIELPVFAEGGSRTVNLLFAKIPTTQVTIKKAADGISISDLNVKLPGSQDYSGDAWTKVPEWKDVETAPDFEITLPGATITLDSKDESKVAQYGNVSLSGGYSSYIGSKLKGNITINSLTVLAGNNINVTGTVGKITIPAGNSNTAQILLNKGSNEKKSGYCYEFENLSGRSVTYKNLLAWDGTSKCEPLKNESGCYLIRSAAELAWFQPTGAPISSTASTIKATMNNNAKLCCSIKLGNKPWLGMVLGENVTFDGGNHTISNVKITTHVINEKDINSTESCVGLFAATLPGSQIKDIEVSDFNATPSAKWCGALVGYSRGTTLYSNCKATNVTIKGEKSNAFRIGGLIGFIGGVSNDPGVTIDKCSVSNVHLQGSYSIGGLVGTIQGSGSRIISNSKIEVKDAGGNAIPFEIKQNAESCAKNGGFNYRPSTQKATYYGPKEYVGNVGKFIGDLASSITLTDNTEPERFTAVELTAFGFDEIKGGKSVTQTEVKELTEEIKTSMKSSFSPTATYSLQDATSGLIPAQVSEGITITIDGKTLTSGTDYNLFKEKKQE